MVLARHVVEVEDRMRYMTTAGLCERSEHAVVVWRVVSGASYRGITCEGSNLRSHLLVSGDFQVI